jgi:hypothetical protein
MLADEEDISKLHPNLLLYKAAAAHNLPVMCEAFALGADKLWNNAEDRSRSPIHQAVISVSFITKYLILWSRLCKKLLGTQVVKKFPGSYIHKSFLRVNIQFTLSHCMPVKFVLLLHSLLCQSLANCLIQVL